MYTSRLCCVANQLQDGSSLLYSFRLCSIADQLLIEKGLDVENKDTIFGCVMVFFFFCFSLRIYLMLINSICFIPERCCQLSF